MYNEMEEWKKKYFDLEVARLQEIEELKHQFDGFKKTSLVYLSWYIDPYLNDLIQIWIKSAKDFQLKFNAERAAYETQILQLHQRVQDYEKQINELLVEIEKHSQLTSDRTRESENWRNKLAAIEDHYKRENAELKSQLEHLKSSNLVKRVFLCLQNNQLVGCETAHDKIQLWEGSWPEPDQAAQAVSRELQRRANAAVWLGRTEKEGLWELAASGDYPIPDYSW